MFLRIVSFSILLCFLSAVSIAQDNGPQSAAKAWWNAVTFGDTAYVNKQSTPALTVTFNNGRSFNRSQIIAQVATHNPSAKIKSEWSDEKMQTPAPQTAIITGRVVETVGNMQHIYKFITVLVSEGTQWKVAAAQSTRELELAQPFVITEANKFNDYAGSYRTPAGTLLKVMLRDTSLVLIDPSGAETRLQAIAPDLFEIPQILSAGNVRFAFNRDGTGRVASLIRIAHKVITMPRMK